MTDEFIRMIDNEKSPVFNGLFDALMHPPSVSIRFNSHKEGQKRSILEGVTNSQVPWEPQGFYLEQRPVFTLDPSLHQGLYYVQDASSMIYGEIMRRIVSKMVHRPITALDTCAAPGGKTTAMLDALPEGSAMIANEFDFGRANVLRENLEKWGSPNIAISRGDTKAFRKVKECFDIIAVDAPCSGEGMFRKEPEAVKQWNKQLVEKCALLQREIVDNVVESLAPGGYLIYSTCTFNTIENEKNVEYFSGNYGLEYVDMQYPLSWNIRGAVNSEIPVARFIPGAIRGEGLSVAVLKKPGVLPDREIRPTSEKYGGKGKTWIENLVVEKKADITWGATPGLAALLRRLDKHLKSLWTRGLEIARMKGSDVIPSHALALSYALIRKSFYEYEVGNNDALKFLKREAIELPSGTPKGYILLTYNGLPLGFVKNIGNRCNNLLPKEWRIRI